MTYFLNLCHIFLISVYLHVLIIHNVAVSFPQKLSPSLAPRPCTILVPSFLLVQLVYQGFVTGPLCLCNDTLISFPQVTWQQVTLASAPARRNDFGP